MGGGNDEQKKISSFCGRRDGEKMGNKKLSTHKFKIFGMSLKENERVICFGFKEDGGIQRCRRRRK